LAAILVRPIRCEECEARFLRWSFREKPGLNRPARTSQFLLQLSTPGIMAIWFSSD